MAAALLAKFLPLDVFEARRLAGGLIGVLGLAVIWRLARRLGGPLAGLLAVILLAACPLFFGHMLMNAKDAPFAVAMIILLLALVRLLSEYPRPSVASIALFGLGLGLSVGSRTLGTLSGVTMLAALALLLGIEANAKGMREALFARRPLRRPSDPRPAAGLCGHGAGLALVGAGAAQSLARGRLFLAFLRASMARTVRRRADPRSRHAAQLCAHAVCPADARNLFGAGLVRPGGGFLRHGAARSAGAAAGDFPLRRDGSGISHRAHGRAAPGHV